MNRRTSNIEYRKQKGAEPFEIRYSLFDIQNSRDGRSG